MEAWKEHSKKEGPECWVCVPGILRSLAPAGSPFPLWWNQASQLVGSGFSAQQGWLPVLCPSFYILSSGFIQCSLLA